MRGPLPFSRILFLHFFRRFFDNDTLQIEGDTTTTIARALAVVTAPSLLVAFFLQNQYPQRSLWGRIDDQYFFVLESFVVMGAVTIFEWEMLFPDRIDFLVLTPLPLIRKQLMGSKASALICFLLLFLVGTNSLGALIYPAICHGNFARQFLAHTVAVAMAGMFSSCAVLAIVGLLRCGLSDRLFRLATPVLQTLLTSALALLVIQYARYGHSIQVLLTSGSAVAKWLPPFWFLAIYDYLFYGSSSPAFVPSLCSVALYACGACLLLVLLLYPLTWSRMHRMSIEGALSRTSAPSRVVQRVLHTVIRRPAERAMFHFLGQTIRRNPRYQIYLAMYGGVGFSLALACAFVLEASQGSITPVVSRFGLHAVVPLLVFWVVAGLRTAFSFPTDLAARWVFRVSGADSRDIVWAGWKWVTAVTFLVCSALLFSFSGLGWTRREFVVQVAFGVSLTFLLADAFFSSRRAPLIEPRLPGRSNFALFLTLYIGVLTPGIFCIIWGELRIERTPWMLLPLLTATIAIHAIFRSSQQAPMEVEEEMEGYEGEFQLLNLS
jgi:hypothetical protein